MKSELSRFERAREQYRWLDYKICSSIDKLCNGVVIEWLDWPDFLDWFNLHLREEEVVPIDKRKVEYLVHTLADYIDNDKDVARYGDVTIYPKWEKLDEEGRLVKLLSLNEADKAKVIKETWEKKVIEKCSISYKDHKKHRDEVKQNKFYDDYRKQSSKNKEFAKELYEILRHFKKSDVKTSSSTRKKD